MGSFGSILSSIVGLFKPKQKAPALAAPVDTAAEQKKSIAGNLSSESSIEDLISKANTFNQDQNISLMEKAMPGYGALSKKLTSTADTLLTDPYNLPKDVQDNIARLAGERGISAGTKGEFNDFSLLRDFGINSLQFGQSRINQAQGITGLLASIAPKVNPLSPLSFYVTPGQAIGTAETNRSAQQSKNNADAAAANLNIDNTWAGYMQAASALFGGGSGKTGNLVSAGASGVGAGLGGG